MSTLTRDSAWTIFSVILGAIRPRANCAVKKTIAICIVSIFSIVIAAVLFSDHRGGHHGQPRDCILSAISAAPCPRQTTAAANLMFHLSAIKQFFLAVTELMPFFISIFLAAVCIFRSAVFRRFWRNIYDIYIYIPHLQAIAIRQPSRVDFPLRE